MVSELEVGPKQPLLRKSPLRVVLGQARFAPKLFDLKRSDFQALAPALAEEYPNAEIAELQQLGFQIAAGAGVQQLPSSKDPLFKFESEDSNWTVSLTPEWFALETTDYRGFHHFAERWLFVANCVLS